MRLQRRGEHQARIFAASRSAADSFGPNRCGRALGSATLSFDRLVHHAEVISLKGDSYRLKNRDLGRVPAAETNNDHQ
ncbi:ATP-binding protein [Streptosporangium saharense]|uniref:ATP-binding protein n=1 Tax=Streptosporangium saharense TaxID=1706840 RepID=UPI003EB7CC3B